MGPAILKYAASGLSREHEQTRIGPGAWSAAELVTHLVDTDLVYADRMKRVIAEDNPPFLAFDPNAWLARHAANDASIPDALALIAANRAWMMRILLTLNDADFGRVGIHSRDGRMTLAEVVARATHHLDHHLRFLYTKRSNLGVALPPRYASEALTT